MCMFCGDPYSVENVLGPLLNHQCCFLSGERSIVLETFLGECKRRVEVIISSFHGANAFRDELVHGFILVYSTKRKASLATLKYVRTKRIFAVCVILVVIQWCYSYPCNLVQSSAFSTNIPNLPIQIMAVTDTGGANAFFSNDLSHLLITEGNAIADKLEAHFMTSASSCQQKSRKLAISPFYSCQTTTRLSTWILFCFFSQLRFTRRSSKSCGRRNRRSSRPSTWRSRAT